MILKKSIKLFFFFFFLIYKINNCHIFIKKKNFILINLKCWLNCLKLNNNKKNNIIL
jgi:hypothetical protein